MPQYGCHIYLNMQSNFTNFSNVAIAALHRPLRLPLEIILDLSISVDQFLRQYQGAKVDTIDYVATFDLIVTFHNDCLGLQIESCYLTNRTLFRNNWTYSKLCPVAHWKSECSTSPWHACRHWAVSIRLSKVQIWSPLALYLRSKPSASAYQHRYPVSSTGWHEEMKIWSVEP